MTLDKKEYKKKVLDYVSKFIDTSVDLDINEDSNLMLTLLSDGCVEIRNKVTNTIHSSGMPGQYDPLENLETWYYRGKLHRENGPAVIDDNSEYWYFNGIKHRADGPAVIYSDGEIEWWYMDEEMCFNDWLTNHPDKELAAIAKLTYDEKK